MGTPSDQVPAVLDAGRGDTTTMFVSLARRDPQGRDAEYLRWHALDHRPEQHRLVGLRGSLRLVSTPACRAARATDEGTYDATDHVMTYLFADPSALGPFMALGAALAGAGRMPLRLPSVETASYEVAGAAAAPRVVIGADVLPWRPWPGVYVLIERGAADPRSVCDVDGVAGVWWATRSDAGATVQITYCFLDDDPVAVAERLRPALGRRRGSAAPAPVLAAPFFVAVPDEWDRYLP